MAEHAFYDKPVLLHRDTHRRLRVRPGTDFGFAARANSVHLAAVEFAEACKDYAIVFRRSASGRILPVAMLGLRGRENLFVDAQGQWQARYLPACVRRYPFVLAELPGQQGLGVCIDEACPGVRHSQSAGRLGPAPAGEEADGEPLFDTQGEPTAYLRNAMDFLSLYQQEYARTETFCRRLNEAGLLREMSAQANLVDGRSFKMDSLLVVDEPRLLALPDAQATLMFRAGDLQLVTMHLLSLSNMQALVDKMAQRPSPLEPAPRPG